MQKVAVSWSGGKDSCLALYEAMNAGYDVSCLLNTISKEYGRVRFHGVRSELIFLQAEALGIPLLQVETSADSYEPEFVQALRMLHARGISAVVFGDIFPHMTAFAERSCMQARLEAIEPLCGRSSEEIFKDFIESGFEAIVVATQANLLGQEWVGKTLDPSFLEDIKRMPGIDACGENGEFHSFVIDGPLFRRRISINHSERVLRNGYWFLDMQECTLKDPKRRSRKLNSYPQQVQMSALEV